MNSQVEPSHYYNKSYDNKGRFISYWHQINEIIKQNHDRVLEIGIGNSFVSNYLIARGIDVITLDIDGELNPGIMGTVLYIPIQDESFDIVACYEVLEHIQYKYFTKALLEISRVSKKIVVFSMPDVSKYYPIYIHIPRRGLVKRLISLPVMKKQIHQFDGEHHWEIGKEGYPLKKIINDIHNTGLLLVKTYRIFEIPYHRFFILQKRD